MTTSPLPRPVEGPSLSRRERLRQGTLQEIADAARRQLREVGAQGLTLSAVAREVGMSAPALYRYVDGVDGLITLLVTQGYESLVAAAESSVAAVPADDLGGRFVAMANALREWAHRDVAQYGLIFGAPLPGYAAPEDGPTTVAAHRASDQLWEVLLEAHVAGRLAPPAVTSVDPEARPLLAAKADGTVAQLPEAVQAAGYAAMALLLGGVAMELFGHMPPGDPAVLDGLWRMQVHAARVLVGLPEPGVTG